MLCNVRRWSASENGCLSVFLMGRRAMEVVDGVLKSG